jgi:hypothetical protein
MARLARRRASVTPSRGIRATLSGPNTEAQIAQIDF